MIPTIGKNFKKIHKVRVICPGWFNMELPNEAFFLLATVAMVTVKILFIFIAAVVRETHSFIKIMQPISSNYNWEKGVKQIRILKKRIAILQASWFNLFLPAYIFTISFSKAKDYKQGLLDSYQL